MPSLDATDFARRRLFSRRRLWSTPLVAVGARDRRTRDRRRCRRRQPRAPPRHRDPVQVPIVVDGHLDEVPWQGAEPATGFVQQQPAEGAPSSQPSEVRFLYDEATLYVGGTFLDDAPGDPIVDTLERDVTTRDGDVVAIVLDTFLDGHNAFTFATNPGGALSDGQSHDDGRQENADWNGVWTVRTGRVAGGWTMEMAIPFRTLRFPERERQRWASTSSASCAAATRSPCGRRYRASSPSARCPTPASSRDRPRAGQARPARQARPRRQRA